MQYPVDILKYIHYHIHTIYPKISKEIQLFNAPKLEMAQPMLHLVAYIFIISKKILAPGQWGRDSSSFPQAQSKHSWIWCP